MNAEESILDRVIETENKAQAAQFNPQEIVYSLLDNLPERDRKIVIMRHGLEDGVKKTLEEIGKTYHITRERVRQIEVSSVKQMRKLIKEKEEYLQAVNVVENILRKQGGIIEESDLVNKIIQSVPQRMKKNVVIFFLSLIKEKFINIKESGRINSGWQLPDFDEELLEKVLEAAQELIKSGEQVLKIDDFWVKFKQTDVYKSAAESIDKNIFLSFIKVSKKLKSNPFGDWGLSNWNLISPRRMNDKIYLVLKHNGKPMHFRKIAGKINEVKFDGKQAHPATVHNELILDHSRYVLVGRGIYALKEWGYKPGIVADVIKDIMLQTDRPMSKKEIINEVLKKRIVKDTTIILALTNKSNFKKLSDGNYQLVADN